MSSDSEKIESLQNKIETIESKVDMILDLLQKDVQPNCQKMNTHINFIENVYENVKNPLGFICSKVNYLRDHNPANNYALDQKQEVNSNDLDDNDDPDETNKSVERDYFTTNT